MGAHTDSGFLSLLLQDDVGGLQVMNGAGEWVDAPPVENTLVVNLGEMLQLAARVLPRDAAQSASSGTLAGARSTGRAPRASQRPVLLEPEAGVRVRADGPAAVGAVDARGRADGGVCRPRRRLKKEKKKEKKKNPLLEAYGANALKSLARSRPEVMARHHPDLVVGEDGAVARRTSARAYRE